MGKTGFLLEGVYRPASADELENFYDPKDYELLAEAERIQGQKPPAGESAPGALQNTYFGPIQNFTDGNGQNMTLNAHSFFNPHTTLISFDGFSSDMTFEVEIMRYFEAVPDSDSTVFEQRSAPLQNFSSPLELLRRQHISNQYFNDITYAGTIWDFPMIRTATDVLQKGLERLDIDFDLKRTMNKQLPKLAKRIVGILTGSDVGEDIAEKIMKGILMDENDAQFAGEQTTFYVKVGHQDNTDTPPQKQLTRTLENRAVSEQKQLTAEGIESNPGPVTRAHATSQTTVTNAEADEEPPPPP